jgi:hypothetical protein
MEVNILENFLKIKSKVKEYIYGQMGENIKVSGLMGNSMESEFIKIKMMRKEKDNGWKEKELNG